jgi:hypothetical protein
LEESSKEPEGQRQGTVLKRCLCLVFQMLQAWVWLAILKGLVFIFSCTIKATYPSYFNLQQLGKKFSS